MAPAAHAAPYRKLLGQHLIPADGGDRFQQGFLSLSHFLEKGEGSASARPDGGGKAYNAYELYLLDARHGGKAGFLGDVLFLSDRERPNHFNFTQLNYLLGLTFKGPSTRLQFDREEDRPLDRKGLSYRYWDARASLEFGGDKGGALARGAVARASKGWERLSGRAMVGGFLHNRSFPARMDLTGLAFLRYNALVGLGLPAGFSFRAEGDWITEKRAGLTPVEMNSSLGFVYRYGSVELSVAQETGKMLDRQGFNRFHRIALTFPFANR